MLSEHLETKTRTLSHIPYLLAAFFTAQYVGCIENSEERQPTASITKPLSTHSVVEPSSSEAQHFSVLSGTQDNSTLLRLWERATAHSVQVFEQDENGVVHLVLPDMHDDTQAFFGTAPYRDLVPQDLRDLIACDRLDVEGIQTLLEYQNVLEQSLQDIGLSKQEDDGLHLRSRRERKVARRAEEIQSLLEEIQDRLHRYRERKRLEQIPPLPPRLRFRPGRAPLDLPLA